MPIHDWSRVFAGLFHAFHHNWITEIQRALNGGLLPAGYYALPEQVSRPFGPDVLTLRLPGAGDGSDRDPTYADDDTGGLAVAVAPPSLAVTDTVDESALYAARQSSVVIRHTTGDDAVAIIELVSRGNKQSPAAVDQFVNKAVGILSDGVSLQFVDVHRPGRHDPTGMHGALWDRLGGTYTPPPGKPLAAAAYSAGPMTTCYVEPLAVGDALPELPLFLTSQRYVNVPLEPTYAAAYADVPERWKRVVEGRA